MLNKTEHGVVYDKTLELCQAIIDHPLVTSARSCVDAFMNDDKAQAQYQELVTQSKALQEKQQLSIPLSDEEVAEFQKKRQTLLENQVAKGFLEAQETMRELHHAVNKYVAMTLENGRVPTPEDVESASCGHGCNCG